MRKGHWLFLLAFMPILSGCPLLWYVSVHDISEPAHPVFCISSSPDCTGSTPDVPLFVVIELNEKNDFNAEIESAVWMLKRDSKRSFRYIRYGEVPQGWQSQIDAKPLELNKLYEVYGSYFLMWRSNDGKILHAVYAQLDREKAIMHWRQLAESA